MSICCHGLRKGTRDPIPIRVFRPKDQRGGLKGGENKEEKEES